LVSGQEGNLDRQQEELTGWVEKLSFVVCGVECECEVVAQRVGTTILFRRIHSGDVKSDSEKCWLHTTFQVSVLYGTTRLSAHS